MSTFRHHPDGWIYIDDKRFSLENFVSQEPGYFLPNGYIGREYVQGKRNSLFTSDTQVGDVKVWTEGDNYISKKDSYSPDPEPIVEIPVDQSFEDQVSEIVTQKGFDTKTAINALVRKVLYNDDTVADELKKAIDDAQVEVSNKITPAITPRV